MYLKNKRETRDRNSCMQNGEEEPEKGGSPCELSALCPRNPVQEVTSSCEEAAWEVSSGSVSGLLQPSLPFLFIYSSARGRGAC